MESKSTPVIYIRRICPALNGIGMQINAGFPGNLAYLLNRLNRADFVIGVHHRDEYGFFGNGLLNYPGQPNRIIYQEVNSVKTHCLQEFTRLQDGMVLDGGCNYGCLCF